MRRYIKEFYRFLKHIVESRELLATLIKNDFKKQYLGSYLGLVWAFLQPLTFMLVIWFVFEVGFRTITKSTDVPFFIWLMSGMIPWFFISDALTTGVNSIVSNDFLVKKVSFRVSILPLVTIGSSLIIHITLVIFLMLVFLLYGFSPSIYWLQLPYYIICSVLLVLGISWMTSAVMVFVKDIGHFMGVVIQIGFWATPIFWNINSVPEKYQYLVKLNPAFYIVEGYRDSLINHTWFWENSSVTFYFLSISSAIFILGAIIFKRLRPHFGDVL